MAKEKLDTYVIRKYIKASSAIDAIQKDRTTPVHDVWKEEINKYKEL